MTTMLSPRENVSDLPHGGKIAYNIGRLSPGGHPHGSPTHLNHRTGSAAQLGQTAHLRAGRGADDRLPQSGVLRSGWAGGEALVGRRCCLPFQPRRRWARRRGRRPLPAAPGAVGREHVATVSRLGRRWPIDRATGPFPSDGHRAAESLLGVLAVVDSLTDRPMPTRPPIAARQRRRRRRADRVARTRPPLSPGGRRSLSGRSADRRKGRPCGWRGGRSNWPPPAARACCWSVRRAAAVSTWPPRSTTAAIRPHRLLSRSTGELTALGLLPAGADLLEAVAAAVDRANLLGERSRAGHAAVPSGR